MSLLAFQTLDTFAFHCYLGVVIGIAALPTWAGPKMNPLHKHFNYMLHAHTKNGCFYFH